MTKKMEDQLCPCGSGKKFKDCCMLHEHETCEECDHDHALCLEEDDDSFDEDEEYDDDDLTETWLTPEQQEFWDDFFQELNDTDASLDQKIGKIKQVIEAGEEMDDMIAHELLAFLLDELRRAGRAGVMDELAALLEEFHPESYELVSGWVKIFRVENALIDPKGDVMAALMELVQDERFEDYLDPIMDLTDRLIYHGRYLELSGALEYLASQLEDEEEDKVIMEFLDEIAQQMLLIIISDAMDKNPDFTEKDIAPPFSDQDVSEEEQEMFMEILRHIRGNAGREWREKDFQASNNETLAQNLFFLGIDFTRWLSKNAGFNPSRAEMVSSAIMKYFDDFESGAKKKKSFKLIPGAKNADEFLGEFLNPLYPAVHRAAAFFLALPEWLRFLKELHLASDKDVSAFIKEFKEIAEQVPVVIDKLEYDPAMLADVKKAAERFR